jgi:antitoxin VapB
MLTRIFKSGNSLAVRIPKELDFGEVAQEVEIERKGDCLVIRPAGKHSLAAAIDAFAAFPEGFMAEEREFHEQNERDWD